MNTEPHPELSDTCREQDSQQPNFGGRRGESQQKKLKESHNSELQSSEGTDPS